MMEKTESKKAIVGLVVGVVTILIITLGATYAFFQIDVQNSKTSSSIELSTDKIDSIAFKGNEQNELHINLKAGDMAETNVNTEYYGDYTKDYVTDINEGMKNLGKVIAEGGNGKSKYICTANAVITISDSMASLLQEGDAYVYINAGSVSKRIDLSELNPSGTKTIPFEIGIHSESEKEITGYIEIINRNDNQTYLAGKNLEVSIIFQVLKCEMGVSKVEEYLRSKDSDNKLTTTLENGLYRYQGNSNVTSVDTQQYTAEREDTLNNNYICLSSSCSGANDENMYRIIGISEDGTIKVIKNTPISGLQYGLPWWEDYKTDINWSQSLAYQYLNNEYYNQLESNLKEKILDTTWKYGDANMNDLMSNPEIMNLMGTLQGSLGEEEQTQTLIELSKLMASETVKLEETNATGKTVGKVSLMSITDYCNSFEIDGNLSCMSSTVAGGLLQSTNPEEYGVTWLTSQNEWEAEWTMSRGGFLVSTYLAWLVSAYGNVSSFNLSNEFPVRPVFYLTSDIDLDGSGTSSEPFTIGLRPEAN